MTLVEELKNLVEVYKSKPVVLPDDLLSSLREAARKGFRELRWKGSLNGFQKAELMAQGLGFHESTDQSGVEAFHIHWKM